LNEQNDDEKKQNVPLLGATSSSEIPSNANLLKLITDNLTRGNGNCNGTWFYIEGSMPIGCVYDVFRTNNLRKAQWQLWLNCNLKQIYLFHWCSGGKTFVMGVVGTKSTCPASTIKINAFGFYIGYAIAIYVSAKDNVIQCLQGLRKPEYGLLDFSQMDAGTPLAIAIMQYPNANIAGDRKLNILQLLPKNVENIYVKYFYISGKIKHGCEYDPLNTMPASLPKLWVEDNIIDKYYLECTVTNNIVQIEGVIITTHELHNTSIPTKLFPKYMGCSIPLTYDRAQKIKVQLSSTRPMLTPQLENWTADD